MSEWPDHASELARKALDHFLDAALKNSEGKLSDAALWLVAETICGVTHGLIPKDDWETIYAAREELGVKFGKRK